MDDFTVVRNCDQMWCTQCHTAFSWRTGRIETHIHNPHYYEWQRRNNGGVAPRNIGDFQCGRELNHYSARSIINKLSDIFETDDAFKSTVGYHSFRHSNGPSKETQYGELSHRIENIIRTTIHLQRVQMPTYQVDQIEDNVNLRVDYLRNKISEEEFKIKIQRANKLHQKKREIGDIIHLFVQTVTDIVYRFHAVVDEYAKNVKESKKESTKESTDPLYTELTGILDEIHALQKYTDECFVDIAKTYSCKRRVIRIYEDGERYRDVLITAR